MKRYLKVEVEKTLVSEIYLAVDDTDPRFAGPLAEIATGQSVTGAINPLERAYLHRAYAQLAGALQGLPEVKGECADLGDSDWGCDQPYTMTGIVNVVPEAEALKYEIVAIQPQ